MDLLQAEIAKRKRERESSKLPRKWMRRGEIEKLRSNQGAEEPSKKSRVASGEEKNGESLTETATGWGGEGNNVGGGNGTEVDRETILSSFEGTPDNVVVRRLRAVGEPVRFFAEDHEARLIRLYRAELDHPELLGTGTRDEFNHLMRRQQDERLESEVPMPEFRDGHVKSSASGKASSSLNQSADGGTVNPEEDAKRDRAAKIHMQAMHESVEGWSREQHIRYFFKHLLREWDLFLQKRRENLRPENKRGAAKLRRDLTVRDQTVEYMKPFFRMLKKRTMDEFIEKKVGQIMDECKQREYQRAHDHYITIAIGNAAWPIGVTMTGIHDRSAREKITEGAVAHVLNDEQARKYLQGMKRLLTFCQIRYPGDPSKMFEYQATSFLDEE